MKFIGKLFSIIIIVSVLLLSISITTNYLNKNPRIVDGIKTFFGNPPPCSRPIYYSLGKFDSRFNINKSSLLDKINIASNAWNQSINKNLLQYSEDGNLKINFIYDNRQEMTKQLNSLDTTISNSKSSYDNLNNQYKSYLIEYNNEKQLLAKMIGNYEAKLSEYNQIVINTNNRGGASKSEISSIESDRKILENMLNQINIQRKSFNILVDKLNTTVNSLNKMAQDLNLTVSKYNNVSNSNGEQFSEGEYIMDESGTSINIYEFSDEKQLIKVLEHEFGHALGLGHVPDSKSVMYYLNQEENSNLTMYDITTLKEVCKMQ